MKIVLVAYYFPPLNSIATHRMHSFANYLQSAGHEILFICPDWSKSQEPFSAAFPVIYTHKMDESIYTDSGKSLRAFIRRKILYKIFAYNKFRDKKPGRFFKEAKNKIDQVDLSSYEFVISSFGPLDAIWIGKYIKERNPKIQWIIDYRDYYSLFYGGFGIFGFYFKRFERKLVSQCSTFITVSETLEKNISQLIHKRGHIIYNGYSDFNVSPDQDFEERIRKYRNYLCYCGTLYHGQRDVRPFLKFYRDNLAEKFTFVVALTDPLDVTYLSEEVSRLGVQNVHIETNLSHNQSLLLIKNAVFPVLLADFDKRSNGFLTGKIFEYIYFRKPVVYSGRTEGDELFSLIKKYNWGEHFEKFDYADQRLITDTDIEFFSRNNQSIRLEHFLQNERHTSG